MVTLNPYHKVKIPLTSSPDIRIQTTVKVGQIAEDIACAYLLKQGLALMSRNYRCRMGEIDLVFLDPLKNNVVFIEVRYRKNIRFGTAAETVTYHKQHKLIKTASHYLQQQKLLMACRFDVIAMGPSLHEKSDIVWIKNAFSVESTHSN